ncbi:MAG: nicotinate phosphoribosyltransferase, partial [Promethearchaeota archaeon]
MSDILKLYRKNRGLFTDLYQLTMAQAYYQLDIKEKKATFELFFRNNPFNGGYAVACGIRPALEYIESLSFTNEDIEYLNTLESFSTDFLEYLKGFSFTGSVDGVLEGTIVYPHVPIIQVTAPIIEAQLIETGLLNIINYSTLIATKSSRINIAARGARVVDFGLRRAHGDSAYLGTRAALVGGCVGTSFVQEGKMLGAPVVGTHAHSFVEMFPSELEAFRAYARVFPDNCLLLIDTYDTLESGVPNAIQVAKELKKQGKELLGVRIDSGDLAYLSVETYRAFKNAGFPGINIVLSNDLDEYVIESITNQILDGGINENDSEKALRKETLSRLLYGVGTKLITGGDDSSLGGVYKLVALDGEPKIKISENIEKTVNPGMKKVFRIKKENGELLADVIGLHGEPSPKPGDWIHHPINPYKKYQLEDGISREILLQPLMESGKIRDKILEEDWKTASDRCKAQLKEVHPTTRRLLNPHVYKVSLTTRLFDLKKKMIKQLSNHFKL